MSEYFRVSLPGFAEERKGDPSSSFWQVSKARSQWKCGFQLGPLNFKIHSHSNVTLQSADESKEEEDMKIRSPHEGLLSHVNVAAYAGVDVWRVCRRCSSVLNVLVVSKAVKAGNQPAYCLPVCFT